MSLKNIGLLIAAIVGALIAGCTDSVDMPGHAGNTVEGITIDGDNIIFDVTLDIPEMANATSRALTDSPDYNQLHLYLIEFDDNGSPITNPLTRVYQAEQERVEGNIVNFRVQLSAAEKPKVLHLIALPKDEELIVGYGLEANIIPHLGVSYGTEAYWRRVEFPNGYCTEAADGTWAADAGLLQKLTRVPLIRNFARISFTCTDPNFIFKGFAVMNMPQAGTIAPWNSKTLSFPNFLDNTGKMLSYNALKSSYAGILPAGTGFDNPVSGITPTLTTDAKYIYERPYSRDRSTFVIFYGRRKGDDQDYYYKLDIGKPDNAGIFRQYNILRNFDFQFTLTKVDKNGETSFDKAIDGIVSNNFSFALNMSNLQNMSDGRQIVYVNKTNFILTDTLNEEKAIFQYKYYNLNDKKYYNFDNNVTFDNLEPGPVIKSVEYSSENDSQNWRTVTITCHKATPETKTQEFTIVNHQGLGRTITMTLHEKWGYGDLREYNGQLMNWNSSTPGLSIAGEGDKDLLTIFFDLPNDLPEAVFPLTFLLESDMQNIDNDPIGNMGVTEGPSFFPRFNGQTHIKYEKTVTLAMYNSLLNADDPTDQGTIIKDNNGNILTHRVHCRMRTTRSLAEMNIGKGQSVTIQIWIQDTEGNFVADGTNNVVTFKCTRTN